jgi:hypothetical protein
MKHNIIHLIVYLIRTNEKIYHLINDSFISQIIS